MKFKRKDAIWYLKVLQKEYAHWQPECRYALDYAIKRLEPKRLENQVSKNE